MFVENNSLYINVENCELSKKIKHPSKTLLTSKSFTVNFFNTLTFPEKQSQLRTPFQASKFPKSPEAPKNKQHQTIHEFRAIQVFHL